MATRKVTRKVKTVAKPEPVKPKSVVGKTVELKVEITIWVDAGADDGRSIEQFRDDVKQALTDPDGVVRAKRVTNTGGYYLVNGKVCLPDDYDPKTRGFKPGAHPPLWAMSADERAIQARIEKEKSLPALARNPEGLRTSKETDDFHKLDAKERRIAETKRVLDDLHENSEWGKRKKAEEEERARLAKEQEEGDEFEFDDEEEPWDDEDEPEEEDEFEWDEDEVMDEDLADEAIEEQTSSVLAKLRGKTVTVPKRPAAKRKVVRRK